VHRAAQQVIEVGVLAEVASILLVTMSIVVLTIIGVAALAGAVPARRAARVNVLAALAGE